MNLLLARLAAIGDFWDGVAAACRHAPRRVARALKEQPYRRSAIVVAFAVLVVYLVAIGDIAVSASGRWALMPQLQTAPDNVFHARAPYLFEPVIALRPTAHLAVFLSPLNLLLGAIVAALAAANIAVARFAADRAGCRRRGYSRVLGALPALLLGFACCTPTVLVALGASTGAVILPVLLPVRSFFYPLTLGLLATTLVWGARGLDPSAREPATAPAGAPPDERQANQ